jgi:hypothetical protein
MVRFVPSFVNSPGRFQRTPRSHRQVRARHQNARHHPRGRGCHRIDASAGSDQA